MKIDTRFYFIIVILIVFADGCAGRASYRFLSGAQRPPAAIHFFDELDTAVSRSGVRNRAYFQVPGFPYLRANRFLVSLKAHLKNDARKDQWLHLMQQLDIEARIIEIQTLPATKVETLAAEFGLAPDRQLLVTKVNHYSNQLLAHDRRQPGFIEALQAAVQNESEYSTLMRVVGLYPLAAIPVAIVTHRVFDQVAEWHTLPLERMQPQGALTAYGPAGVLDYSGQQVRKIIVRSRHNPLGIPLPSADERNMLLAFFAPVIIQDSAADYDRIGAVEWSQQQLKINAGSPMAYYYFTHAYFKGEPILQINYVIWYSARDGPNSPWIERGNMDGLTIRVSLDPGGDPFMLDIMNNCGCYQFFVPRRQKVRRILPSPLAIDAFVPTTLPDGFPQTRISIRVNSGWHQVERITAAKTPANAIPYTLVPYEQLEMLKRDGTSHESMFTANGIGKFSERIESDIFIPMGIPLVGSMRQRGHHAIKFIGRAHFDDPHLLDEHFEFK